MGARMSLDRKAAWGPGPWQSEPDHLEWKDERTGLECRIIRNMIFGNLCGYVGVPPSHPYFGWDRSDDIKLAPGDLETSTVDDIGVFDALVYAMQGGPERGTIPLSMTLKAHHGITWSGQLPTDDDAAGFWFFGFDCGHAWDVTPAMDGLFKRYKMGEHPIPNRKYRDIEYVKREVTSLAFQLKQMETRVLLDEGVLKMIGAKS
jgi:hypothetical protein